MRRRGFNDAGVVDNIIDDVFCHICRQQNSATFGADFAIIFHCRSHWVAIFIQRREGGFFAHREAIKVIAIEIDGEGLRAAQHHGAKVRLNDAIVTHARRYQRNKATFRGSDGSFVNNARIWAASFIKNQFPSQEVRVAGIRRANHQASHIHLRAGAKECAAAIDNHQAAVRRQATENLRWVAIQHAVQRNGACAR